MARRQRNTRSPALFLRSPSLADPKAERPKEYPFTLPWLTDDFELELEEPNTILMGENGTGKSTLVEAVAAIAGYDETSGGKGYMPVDHDMALDKNGGDLDNCSAPGGCPKSPAAGSLAPRPSFRSRAILTKSPSSLWAVHPGLSQPFSRRRLRAVLRRTHDRARHLLP